MMQSQQKVNLGCVLALSLQQIRKYPYIVPELFSVWPASLDVQPFHTKLSKLGDWISSFNWDSLDARLNSHDLTWSDMKKKKQIKCIWEPISKQQKNKMFIKFRIKTIQIINQKRLFCRKRVPGSSWLMKEVLDIDILITKNGDRKIMHPIWLTKRSVIKTRKRNQFGQFWWTSKKVIPIVKSSTGFKLTVSQGFQRGTKWKTNSPTYPFLQLIQGSNWFFKVVLWKIPVKIH